MYFKRVNDIKRLLCMFTIINLGAVLAFPYHPPDIQDVVRATTLLILVVVASIWFSGNIVCAYGELYDSFVENNTDMSIKKNIIVFIADMLLHVVPVIVLGLPHSALSMLIAYGLLLVWYSVFGDKIGEIYAPSVDGDMAIGVGGLFTVGFVLWRA